MSAVALPMLPSLPSMEVGAMMTALADAGRVIASSPSQLRNLRELQRSWDAAAEASRQAHAKALRVAQIQSLLKKAVGDLSPDESTMVVQIRLCKQLVIEFANSLEAALDAGEAVQKPLRSLNKFRSTIVKVYPKFDSAAESMSRVMQEIPKLRIGVVEFRAFAHECDVAISQLVDLLAEQVRERIKHYSSGPAPSVAEGLKAYDDVCDSLVAIERKLAV